MDLPIALLQIDIRRGAIRRRRKRRLRLRVRNLRDTSDPFDVDEPTFVNLYRLSHRLARELIRILEPRLIGVRATKIPPHLQVLTALRFFAGGDYQVGLAQYHLHPSSQPSVSRIIERVASALGALAPYFIRFPQTRRERLRVRNGFLRNNQINSILGIIDCFVVKLIRPRVNEEAFVHYRHGPSLNVQVICDSRYVIQDIRVCPGSSNDQHIWNHSQIKAYLERLRMDVHVTNREGRYYLLGDSGYALSQILLTPILDADENTPEFAYTHDFLHTRCKVEQTFGLLTNVHQCISRRRVLHYIPERATTFIIASAVLHNFRLLRGLAFPLVEPDVLMQNFNEAYNGSHNAGVRERNNIVQLFYNI